MSLSQNWGDWFSVLRLDKKVIELVTVIAQASRRSFPGMNRPWTTDLEWSLDDLHRERMGYSWVFYCILSKIDRSAGECRRQSWFSNVHLLRFLNSRSPLLLWLGALALAFGSMCWACDWDDPATQEYGSMIQIFEHWNRHPELMNTDCHW